MAKYNNLRLDRVTDAIREYMDLNKLGADDPLPSERKLSELWQVSRGTVRKAIDSMCREGCLYTVQGKGSFVAPEKEHIDMQDMISFSGSMVGHGRKPESKVLSKRIEKADKALSDLLKIQEGDEVHVLTRIRKVDGRAILLEVSHIPAAKCPGIARYDFEKASLYEILEIHYGIYMKYQDITVRLSKASAEEAKYLNINQGDPVFVEKGVALSGKENEVIEYTKTIVNAKCANYTIHIDQSNLDDLRRSETVS